MADQALRRATGRTGRRILVILIAVGAVMALLCMGFAPSVFTSIAEQAKTTARFGASACGGAGLAVTGGTTIEGLNAEQLRNASVIVGVGRQMNVPARGWVIAVATAMQESTLHNYDVAVDHDSLGLFQQRPSSGWGTRAQILDPRYSSSKFYEKLMRVPGWQRMRLTDAAQAVQISAYPDRYQRWEPFATILVNRLTNGAANGVAGTAGDPVRCAAPGQVSAAGWTVPSPGLVGSGFRPPDRPSHYGVDVIAGRGTLIRAAAAGIVITSLCNASSGSCDQDGSPAVMGCGWYVEIAHGGGLSTRYCHMVRRPAAVVGQRVTAGEAIGHVGSSGNSSGPHLHYETRVNGVAVDPVPFMAARGAPLGSVA